MGLYICMELADSERGHMGTSFENYSITNGKNYHDVLTKWLTKVGKTYWDGDQTPEELAKDFIEYDYDLNEIDSEPWLIVGLDGDSAYLMMANLAKFKKF